MKIYAWQFLKDDGTAYEGYRPPIDGSVERIDGPPILCGHGFHGSCKPLDALKYAHGCLVRRVVLSGEIMEDSDKLCATQRRELWRVDATMMLHEFAIWCVLKAISPESKLGYEPDPRILAAIEIKRRWLRGEEPDHEMLRALFLVRQALQDLFERGAVYAGVLGALAGPGVEAWAAARSASCAVSKNIGNRKLHTMLLGIRPKKGDK